MSVSGDVFVPIETFANGNGFTDQLQIGGDLRADIRALGLGVIEFVDVDGDVIGTAQNPVRIECDTFFNDINIAGDATHLTFKPLTLPGQFAGPSFGSFTVGGGMIGEIQFPNSKFSTVRIGRGGAGDFSGTMRYALQNPGTVIEIGGELTAGSLIQQTQTQAGTRNLIVINNNDSAKQWLGQIEIVGVELDSPQYPESQADLADSAVGQVPFLIHGTDSELVFEDSSGTTTLAESFVDEVIWKAYTGVAETLRADVRFFGQVRFLCEGTPGGGGGGSLSTYPASFRFERRPVGGSTWHDISDCYAALMAYSIENVSFVTTVVLTGGVDNFQFLPMDPVTYRNGFEYRIVPIRDIDGDCEDEQFINTVLCDLDRLDQNALNVPVGDDAITWRVGNLCPADLNVDGVVDAADLGIFLNAFGNEDPDDGDCLELIGDINGDNLVDATDLGILLNVFGNNACGPSDPAAMAMAMMGAPGTITSAQLLTALGFESADAFAAFVAELEPAKQLEAITAAWLLAQSLEEGAQEQSE